MEPFGCELVRSARSARPGDAGPAVHPVRELPSLLPAADAVVLCAPPTEETRGMFGAHRPASLKDGATLVNVGRGELVDTDALTRKVGSGRLRAALDVAALEPLPGAHPLWRQPEALITPHAGTFTDASAKDSATFLPRRSWR
ncbi:NAD(P)-dependent oxidoreductase [Streptomyces griseoviridis]|uniref:NAD(P)-dependent oxidoreductase n=1 Tax=Streptomyces griseoviridis TaxID=45398 RepID=UPI001E603361|nr:NAD(P)-dependent oxidoreductase [Streptomyces niveoruber]